MNFSVLRYDNYACGFVNFNVLWKFRVYKNCKRKIASIVPSRALQICISQNDLTVSCLRVYPQDCLWTGESVFMKICLMSSNIVTGWNLKERGHLEDLDVDWRNILKWILKKWEWRLWTEFRIGTYMGSFGFSWRRRGFIDQLSKY
jgi:hypothetical protein